MKKYKYYFYLMVLNINIIVFSRKNIKQKAVLKPTQVNKFSI